MSHVLELDLLYRINISSIGKNTDGHAGSIRGQGTFSTLFATVNPFLMASRKKNTTDCARETLISCGSIVSMKFLFFSPVASASNS
jgi:hypothetical protein